MSRPLLCLAAVLTACAGPAAEPPAAARPAAPATTPASAEPTSRPAAGPAPALEAVAAIHGGAGPFAAVGYRMGQAALRELDLERGSSDVAVEHAAPREVQWSCVVDGLQAATGASLGRLNLRLVEVTTPEQVASRVTSRRTGTTMRFEVTERFAARFLDVPPERLDEAAREVLDLPEEDLFTWVIE